MSGRKTLYVVRDGAAWITLNAPEARNSLSEELVASLHEDVTRALDENEARCIVLTGAGTAFCAGADLKAVKGPPPAANEPTPFVQLLRAIWNAPKPVIAAINGAAFAGGLGLVAAADIAVAVETVKFSFSEVRIGVIPAVISVVCIPKLGAHNAMRLFLTGETFSAAQAVSYGLIHRTAPAEKLHDLVQEEIDMIRRGAPKAIAESKRLVRRICAEDIDAAFAWTQVKSAEMFAAAEATEGMAAFREKRSPNWVVTS